MGSAFRHYRSDRAGRSRVTSAAGFTTRTRTGALTHVPHPNCAIHAQRRPHAFLAAKQ
jgi:hypothetical protein